MRRKRNYTRVHEPDIRYGSAIISKLINHIMQDGKKSIARSLVYDALDEIKESAKTDDVLAILEEAIKNVSPTLEVKSRRIGGATYQVPREVRGDRRLTLAIRWLIKASRLKKGKPMAKRLAEEILLAKKGEGAAVKKKEDTHRMAEANRAFAHFAW